MKGKGKKMNITITKEDFKLLMEMYNEAFDMIILKKHFNIDIPSNYNAKKYTELKDKLYKSADKANIEESELDFDENNFITLTEKITKNKSEQLEILTLQMKELFSVEENQEELLSMFMTVAKDFEEPK